MISAVRVPLSATLVFSTDNLCLIQNVGGYTKRQTFQSVLFIGYCIGSKSDIPSINPRKP